MDYVKLLLLSSLITQIKSQYYQYENEHDDNNLHEKLTPLDAMVDTTNHLAFKILHLHSKANKNNIAFSPCGLASILVALYEGSTGKSSLEIQQMLHFPTERDVVRVGFRDIHRRLRSYFYQHNENLLSGLSLSQENITIKHEYESILRFYGYDLSTGEDMNMSSEIDDKEEASTVDNADVVVDMMTTEEMAETVTPSSTTEITTVKTDKDSIDISTTTALGTTVTDVPTTITTTSAATTTRITTTTTRPTTRLTTTTTTTTAKPTTTTTRPTTTEPSTIPSTFIPSTTTDVPTLKPNLFTFKPLSTEPEVFDTLTTSLPTPSPLQQTTSRAGRNINFKRNQFQFHGVQPQNTVRFSTLKIKRSPIEYDIPNQPIYYAFPQQPTYQHQILPPAIANQEESPLKQQTTAQPPAQPQVPPYNAFQNYDFQQQLKQQNDDFIEHYFYVNNYDTIQIPFKIYNSILKYAYVESIHSTLLELELDSDYYSLLIILPDYQYGLENLLRNLNTHPFQNLREIKKQMKYAWVKSIVPKFNLKGNILLTNDLQNLGINDIFEPSKANFSPMTDDPHIYAKHVEQSININIRTNALHQLKRFTSIYKNPVEIAVNYPFLFCIVDKELDVALIAGRILNPLNSRIQ